MFEEKVRELLDKALQEKPDFFLINFEIKGGNTIEVIIDGDQGVKVEDCIAISRAIEHNLDREEEDFSLQVMSAGVTEGLVHQRQYQKNIGRILAIKTLANETFEGELIEVSDETFTLKWKAREPKPLGKGKITVEKTHPIQFGEVKKANVVIKFN